MAQDFVRKSNPKKTMKWVFLAAVVVAAVAAGALVKNSIRYFSESGLRGYYLAAIHSLDVLQLPETPPIDVPEGLTALTHEELRELPNGKALNYLHPTRRELRAIVRFVSPNEYTSSSSLGPALEVWRGHYILDGNRICNLPTGAGIAVCYRLYRNAEGKLLRFVHAHQEFPAEWQEIEPYHR